jgi:hypothetical protein
LINNQVLSENEFQLKIQSILIEFEHELSNNFIQSLNIFQNYVQNNQLITLTQSNWNFDIQYNKTYDLIHLIPIIRSNCFCATSNLCFDKAKLYLNDNQTLTIQDFQIGYTPLDSILSSTLECLYQQSCINYIINAFKIPFNVNILQFNLNNTIETLFKNLFIEKWNSSTNYSNYYVQIRPNQCFYSNIKRNNLLSVIIEIVGIYGSLTATLCFILPIINGDDRILNYLTLKKKYMNIFL